MDIKEAINGIENIGILTKKMQILMPSGPLLLFFCSKKYGQKDMFSSNNLPDEIINYQ